MIRKVRVDFHSNKMAKSNVKSAISNVTPQIIMGLYMIGMSSHFTITQLMLMDKVCSSKYSNEVCNDLGQHEAEENLVQTETSQLNTNVMLLSMVPSGFVTLILGPLSDIYGRKRIVLITTVTTLPLALSLLYQSASAELSTSVLYVGAFVSGLGGGIGAFMSTVINYVTDVTSEDQRTEKLSSVLPFFLLGQTVGGLMSGIVAEYVGTTTVYMVFVITTTLTVFVVIVFMEQRGTTSSKDGKQSSRESVSLQMIYGNLTKGGKALIAPRPGTQRLQLILLTFVTAILCMVCMAADMAILPLYVTRAPLKWKPVTLSYQNALKTIAMVIGQAALTPMLIRLTGSKGIVGDFLLVALGLFAGGVASIIHGLAQSTWVMMTIAPLAVMFAGPGQPATSSLTSKLVDPSETGALTAFCSFLNSLSIPIGTLLFSMLYSNTIQSMPSATFLTTAVFNFIGGVMILLARSYAVQDEMKDVKKK